MSAAAGALANHTSSVRAAFTYAIAFAILIAFY
jgi:hypothetical protein